MAPAEVPSCAHAAEPKQNPSAIWPRGRLLDFEGNGLLDTDREDVMETMTDVMRVAVYPCQQYDPSINAISRHLASRLDEESTTRCFSSMEASKAFQRHPESGRRAILKNFGKNAS